MKELLRLLRSAADTLEPFTREIRSGTLVWNGAENALPEKLQELDPHALMWFSRLTTIASLLERGGEVTESQLQYLRDIFRGSMGTLSDFWLDNRRWGRAAEEANYKLHKIASQGLLRVEAMLRDRDIVRNYRGLRGTDRPGYETLGRFEVPDAQRIIDRLDEEHIPFEIDAPFEVRPIPKPYRVPHWLYIYVRPEFKKRADEIVLEGSQL